MQRVGKKPYKLKKDKLKQREMGLEYPTFKYGQEKHF